MTKEDILSYLKEHKKEMKDKYSVKKIALFGSYARDVASKNSDIDLLVDFKETPDLLTFIELEEVLSKSLQKNVDLVPRRKLKKAIKDQVLKEAIAVWNATTGSF